MLLAGPPQVIEVVQNDYSNIIKACFVFSSQVLSVKFPKREERLLKSYQRLFRV